MHLLHQCSKRLSQFYFQIFSAVHYHAEAHGSIHGQINIQNYRKLVFLIAVASPAELSSKSITRPETPWIKLKASSLLEMPRGRIAHHVLL